MSHGASFSSETLVCDKLVQETCIQVAFTIKTSNLRLDETEKCDLSLLRKQVRDEMSDGNALQAHGLVMSVSSERRTSSDRY